MPDGPALALLRIAARPDTATNPPSIENTQPKPLLIAPSPINAAPDNFSLHEPAINLVPLFVTASPAY